MKFDLDFVNDTDLDDKQAFIAYLHKLGIKDFDLDVANAQGPAGNNPEFILSLTNDDDIKALANDYAGTTPEQFKNTFSI